MVKALVAKPDDLTVIPWMHLREGANQHLKVIL